MEIFITLIYPYLGTDEPSLIEKEEKQIKNNNKKATNYDLASDEEEDNNHCSLETSDEESKD